MSEGGWTRYLHWLTVLPEALTASLHLHKRQLDGNKEGWRFIVQRRSSQSEPQARISRQ